MVPVLVGVVALALGVAIGFVIRKAVARSQAESAEGRAQKVILEAEREAERLTREALVEAKDEIGALRRETEEDVRDPPRRDQAPGGAPDPESGEDPSDRKVDEARPARGGAGRARPRSSRWSASSSSRPRPSTAPRSRRSPA